MRLPLLLSLTALAAAPLFSQPELQFEVASVRALPPVAAGTNGGFRAIGGPGTQDPTHLRYTQAAIFQILARTFQMQADQFVGPDWVTQPYGAERYEILANVPEGATQDEAAKMMLNLLKERFHLAYHRETKPDTVYALVAGKHGPQLHPNEPTPGRIPYPTIGGNSLFTLTGSGKSMKQLADAITPFVDLPVVDATGLKGEYDFSLVWLANIGLSHPKKKDLPPGVHKLAKRVEDALKQQLGLKLVTRRMPVEFLIVDSLLRVPVEP